MQEIQDIIAATKQAYARFAATNPDKETRQAVRNAVLFLSADLESADQYAQRRHLWKEVA